MSEVKMMYRNWRGETALRSFTPVNMFHGTNEYHPVADWLIEGMDNDKNAVRTFALRGFDMTDEIALRDAMLAERNAMITELVGALEDALDDLNTDIRWADCSQLEGLIDRRTKLEAALTKAKEMTP